MDAHPGRNIDIDDNNDGPGPTSEIDLRDEAPGTRHRNFGAAAIAIWAGLALMALGGSLHHSAPAATRAPAMTLRPSPTIELPEMRIVGDAAPAHDVRNGAAGRAGE